MAKKVAKKQGGRRGRKPKTRLSVTDSGLDIFEIEIAPPPAIRGADPERLAFLAKLARTVKAVQPGQAFIIPSKYRSSAKRYVEANESEFRFTCAVIPDNPEVLRMYKFEWLGSKPKK